MALSVEKNWLMDYGILRLVNQCRRHIVSEFGVKPALYDESLREMLSHYARRSRNPSLKECWGRLQQSLNERERPSTAVEPEPQLPPARMYRGRPLPEPVATESGARDKRPVVIYRGRAVPKS
jgi:hypothetical protein